MMRFYLVLSIEWIEKRLLHWICFENAIKKSYHLNRIFILLDLKSSPFEIVWSESHRGWKRFLCGCARAHSLMMTQLSQYFSIKIKWWIKFWSKVEEKITHTQVIRNNKHLKSLHCLKLCGWVCRVRVAVRCVHVRSHQNKIKQNKNSILRNCYSKWHNICWPKMRRSSKNGQIASPFDGNWLLAVALFGVTAITTNYALERDRWQNRETRHIQNQMNCWQTKAA